MTKNIGMLLLAIYLILVGITTLFHVAIGAIVMGILALITGILILVGKWLAKGIVATGLWAVATADDARRWATVHSAPTAAEISNTTMQSEIEIWIIAKIFAHRASNGASVGPNVELWVTATNR